MPDHILDQMFNTIERAAKGPASEINMDEWCIDCGHHKNLHHLNPHERLCKYWTDLCECEGFVSRSEALAAVRGIGG